jgi:hypothetical protein
MFVDHSIAMIAIGICAGAVLGGSPKHMITGAIFSGFTLSPMTYWLKLQGNRPG